MKAKARRDVASRDPAEIQPRSSRETAEIQPRASRETAESQPKGGRAMRASAAPPVASRECCRNCPGALSTASPQASADRHVNHSMNDERAQVERHYGCTSAAPRLHLGCTSAVSRRRSGRATRTRTRLWPSRLLGRTRPRHVQDVSETCPIGARAVGGDDRLCAAKFGHGCAPRRAPPRTCRNHVP